jgi:hypothetical protein
MDRGREPACHIGEGVWCVTRRHRARRPEICQREHLAIAADEGETVESIRQSGGAVHHRSRRRVWHRRQRTGVREARLREESAEQRALRVVGRIRWVLTEVLVASGILIGIATQRDRLDLSHAVRERGDRRIPGGGRLAQRSRESRLGLRPWLGATGGERQHGAITDRREKRISIELEILIVLAGEQQIEQRSECELLSRLGCGRGCDPVEQGTGQLRLVIERHARARDAGVFRTDAYCEGEIEQRDTVVAIDEDVSRMDVAVHDPAPVQAGIDIEHADPKFE